MNIQEYIDSGVLYDYCMGVLSEIEKTEVDAVCAQYPDVMQELLDLRQALDPRASTPPEKRLPDMQESLWGILENVNKEKAGNINDLPLINKYSDYTNWQRMVIPFMPKEFNTDREVQTLRDSGGVTQLLVLTRTDVAEEVHEHEKESFLVLEGECECHIGTDIYRIGPGGFIEIPLHTKHNVRVLSPYVVAVLQHLAV